MDFELLYRFFEGLATQEEEKKIKAWLESSPENEKRFLEERKAFDAILLNSDENKVRTVYINQEKPNPRIFIYFKEVIKIAAVIAIAALGSWIFFSQDKPSSDSFQTIHVPAGQRLNLTLPDGTNVWLNSKTTIQYPVSFNSKERLITLDGQAYFDVAKNEKAPFIVKTKIGQVKALGTKFDILSYSDTEIFEATLMEGKVKVNLLNSPNEYVILDSGNKASLSEDRLVTAVVRDFNLYEWRNGIISFRNETFENMMKYFEKTYDIKIVVQNPKVSSHVFTGKFRIVDGIEYALRVLQRDARFKYDRDTEKSIIYIR